MLLYLTPQEFVASPEGIALAQQLQQLGPGVLDQLLARASARCDAFCMKRLGAHQTTILSTNVAAGATLLQVASTLGYDNSNEQSVILNPGGATQEILPIVSGGVVASSPSIAPYPGTITLASPAVYAHTLGEAVQGALREVMQVGSSSSGDFYSELFGNLSQDAQIAAAHLPQQGLPLSRVVFTRHYPIISLYALDHAYSYTNAFHTLPMTIETLSPAEGWFRFNTGAFVTPQGIMRTTYTAGMQAINDDIKQAVLFYIKDILQDFINPYGLVQQTMGKRSTVFSRGGVKSPNQQAAEQILQNYRKVV